MSSRANRISQAMGTCWLALALLGGVVVDASETGGEAAEPPLPPAEAPPAEDGAAGSLTAAQAQAVIYDRVTVVGSESELARLPGSAHVLTRADLEKQAYSDIHRILRQVPGINIQEEDGFGLRPNIGIRGTGVERSQKITLLEDGVLIAPAPYAAPAAYYAPTAGRMEGVEVRKGSAAVTQGPYTLGGAVNLISKSIPGERGGNLEVMAGDHGTWKLDGTYGASYERVGFLVETYQQRTDGFKELDGGGSTGFELADYLGKLRFSSAPGARRHQQLEIKAGRTEQDGRETYLGLTAADFAATPLRRYAGSQEDRIDTEHEQIQLRYFVVVSDRLDWTTTVYRNDFFRNWHKNESVLGVSNRSVLEDPLTYAAELAVLRGEVDSPDDALAVRNNRRDYYSQGVQSVVSFQPRGAWAGHSLRFGMRLHEDEEDRFQEDDLFAMRGGRMVLTSAGAPGSNANRVGDAEALALFAEDRVAIGKWTLTPGLRYETVDLARRDWAAADPQRAGGPRERRNEIDVLVPGLGASYELRPQWHVFAGVHRGFSPPGPSSTEEVEPEESVNYEAGTRYRKGAASAELTAFFNDYDNLLGADTLSGGGTGTGDLFNGGAVDVYGLEAACGTELWRGARFAVPVRASYTYTRGEFRTSFETEFEDWAPAVARGDELPYMPEHQIFAEIGLVAPRWGVNLNGHYVSEMRTRAGRGVIAEGERIEDHVAWDLAARYRVGAGVELRLQVRNLFDEVYVASRRPYGLRPGLPRTALVGLAVDF